MIGPYDLTLNNMFYGMQINTMEEKSLTMFIDRIGAVEVIVSDLEKSTQWYKEKLGAEIVAEYLYWKCIDLRVGKSEALIDLGEPDRSWGHEEYLKSKERIGKPTGIIFETRDIERAYKMLKQKGIKFTRPPTKTEWGDVIAQFIDPDGNEFKMVQSQ